GRARAGDAEGEMILRRRDRAEPHRAAALVERVSERRTRLRRAQCDTRDHVLVERGPWDLAVGVGHVAEPNVVDLQIGTEARKTARAGARRAEVAIRVVKSPEPCESRS